MDLINAQICGNLLRCLQTIARDHDHRDPGRFELCDCPLRRKFQSVRHACKCNDLPGARGENHRFALAGQSLCRGVISAHINPARLQKALGA